MLGRHSVLERRKRQKGLGMWWEGILKKEKEKWKTGGMQDSRQTRCRDFLCNISFHFLTSLGFMRIGFLWKVEERY